MSFLNTRDPTQAEEQLDEREPAVSTAAPQVLEQQQPTRSPQSAPAEPAGKAKQKNRRKAAKKGSEGDDLDKVLQELSLTPPVGRVRPEPKVTSRHTLNRSTRPLLHGQNCSSPSGCCSNLLQRCSCKLVPDPQQQHWLHKLYVAP